MRRGISDSEMLIAYAIYNVSTILLSLVIMRLQFLILSKLSLVHHLKLTSIQLTTMNRKREGIVKVLMALLFLQLTTAVVAQYTYKPFIGEGKVWNMSYKSILYVHPATYSYQYVMKGDTIIGGDTMKKVFLTDSTRYHDNNQHYFCAVKEEGKVVSVIYEGQSTLTQLYDFEKGLTELAQANPYHPTKPYEKDYWLMTNSICRHVFSDFIKLDGWSDWKYVDMTEGIGYSSFLDPFTGTPARYLVSCSEGGHYVLYYDGITVPNMEYYNYKALLKDGRSWVFSTRDGSSETEMELTVKGDTVLEYRPSEKELYYCIYWKVYRTDESMYGDKSLHYYGAMRENRDGVVCLMEGDTLPDKKTLMWFNIYCKEPFPVNPHEDNPELMRQAYATCDSVTSCSHRYRCFTLELYQGGKPLTPVPTGRFCHWTEGIGSDLGVLGGFTWDVADGLTFKVYDGNECIYDHSELYPVSDGISCVSLPNVSPSPYFNLQGCRLKGEPKRGIYIKDGKKVLVGDKR